MDSRAGLTLVGESVAVVRAGRVVIDNVSFVVGSGEALVVSGANGAGKSTLLRAIAGLIRPASGRVALCGAALPAAAHLVGHRNALKPQASVFDNARFWAAFQGGGEGAGDRAEAALDAAGLGALADAPAAFLSQGQARRLALARVLAAPRPLWLLDEPVAGLDAAARRDFARAMAGHLGGGGLIVAATHEPLGLDAARTLAL